MIQKEESAVKDKTLIHTKYATSKDLHSLKGPPLPRDAKSIKEMHPVHNFKAISPSKQSMSLLAKKKMLN